MTIKVMDYKSVEKTSLCKSHVFAVVTRLLVLDVCCQRPYAHWWPRRMRFLSAIVAKLRNTQRARTMMAGEPLQTEAGEFSTWLCVETGLSLCPLYPRLLVEGGITWQHLLHTCFVYGVCLVLSSLAADWLFQVTSAIVWLVCLQAVL